MGRGRSSAEARETEERGSERLSGRAETHSGISPLALPISGVLHWPPQPSRKRYRINVSLITYTASARTPTLSWRKRHPFLDYLLSPFFPPASRHLSRHGASLVTTPRVKETNVYYNKKGSNCATATFLSRAPRLLLLCQLKGIIPANSRTERWPTATSFRLDPPWNPVPPADRTERFAVQ